MGDRVMPIFDLNHLTGTEMVKAALGGDLNGVLREYAIFDEKDSVHFPKYLSWDEADTITCAGTTAWHALNMPGSSDAAKVALLQGKLPVSHKDKRISMDC
ncbi:zinc-type alcohol dehydrogenase-like protein [Penicillium sp. IBT 18751x]|nr:zinc-type alcohol dehydrogenase-like protein [Penicillium sp. IBT 18751x]